MYETGTDSQTQNSLVCGGGGRGERRGRLGLAGANYPTENG